MSSVAAVAGGRVDLDQACARHGHHLPCPGLGRGVVVRGRVRTGSGVDAGIECAGHELHGPRPRPAFARDRIPVVDRLHVPWRRSVIARVRAAHISGARDRRRVLRHGLPGLGRARRIPELPRDAAVEPAQSGSADVGGLVRCSVRAIGRHQPGHRGDDAHRCVRRSPGRQRRRQPVGRIVPRHGIWRLARLVPRRHLDPLSRRPDHRGDRDQHLRPRNNELPVCEHPDRVPRVELAGAFPRLRDPDTGRHPDHRAHLLPQQRVRLPDVHSDLRDPLRAVPNALGTASPVRRRASARRTRSGSTS